MPSLNQILATSGPLLLLDAASTRIQVGLLSADGAARWQASEEEAGVGLFLGVDALGVDLATVGAFAFCSGPGSILGIRTAAMALRTWNVSRPRRTYAYGSLALVANALRRPGLSLVADARRDSWHVLQLGGELRRVPTAEVPAEALMPEGFRHWSPLPSSGVGRTPYLLSDLFAQPSVAAADLFQATDDPDAFLHEEPSYVTWTPRMHGA